MKDGVSRTTGQKLIGVRRVGSDYRLSACPHLCLVPLISCSGGPVRGGQVPNLRSLEGLGGCPDT